MIDDLLDKTKLSRRSFLGRTAQAAALAALAPSFRCGKDAEKAASTGKVVEYPRMPEGREAMTVGPAPGRMLLKNGLIVDGTGKKAFYGDLLIEGSKIGMVTPKRIAFDGPSVDCAGMVVSPGFIDAHSHMDWNIAAAGMPELKMPYTEQGITAFMGGQCGHGIAGYRKKSAHMDMLQARTGGIFRIQWRSYDEYFRHCKATGISHNLAVLTGNGSTRTSMRGYESGPLSPDERKEILRLHEEAMDQGARGVSLGLQYEPDVFMTMDEIRDVARLVKKKDKLLAVHLKAYSSLSGTYPLNPFGEAHNLQAIKEMLDVARDTGVRLQISHLIYVGTKTWKTVDESFGLIDRAIADGLDVKFDTYAYNCGTSIINVIMPEWFLADIPAIFDKKAKLAMLYTQLKLIPALLGWGLEYIQITNAGHPELDRYNGMFMSEIADKRKMSDFDNLLDYIKKTGGRARVLNHGYSTPEIVRDLMRHPASLFMTDATVAQKGVQNPAAFGNFPLHLQYARDYRLMGIEETVRKMTGASAERYGIKDRGILAKGMYADITVFDWMKVKDNNSAKETNRRPTGISEVFINGKQVLAKGIADRTRMCGMVV